MFVKLAYAMQEAGETIFDEAEALAVLPKAVKWQGEKHAILPTKLFQLGRGATILEPLRDKDEPDPKIRFNHQFLHEYFASLELLRRFEAGEDLGDLWKAPRLATEMPPSEAGEWDQLPTPPTTRWEVTTILACGLAQDPAGLIEAVRRANPSLAGCCLDEAGIARPEQVARSVRADLLADIYDPQVHLRARL